MGGLPVGGLPAGAQAALRAVVSARTWLAVIYQLTGLVIGICSFVIVMAGTVIGIALVPFFLAGVPVLVAVFWLCDWFARTERARFGVLLGQDIPGMRAQGGRQPRRRSWRLHPTPSQWRHFGYALLRLPLSVLEALAVIVVWGASVALLTLPAYSAALPGGGAHLGGVLLRGPAALIVAALVGAALLLTAPQLTRALAAGDAAVARWLLAPARRVGLAARIGELETSRARVVDAADAERRRIERDLHDGAQQRLVSLAMELGRAKAKFAADPQAAEAIVGQAHEQAKAALTELRNLVRGVHPPVLSHRGLDAALSGLAALCPVPVTVRMDLTARPPAPVEAIAYFVVAEALTNVAKHARATRAEVTVGRSGGLLMVVITDDGIGGADPGGQGLSGLADRVAAVDGRLSVTSPAGGPTTVEVALPCGS